MAISRRLVIKRYILDNVLREIDNATHSYPEVVSGLPDALNGLPFPKLGCYISGGYYTYQGVPIGSVRDTISVTVVAYNNVAVDYDEDSMDMHQDIEQAMMADTRLGNNCDSITTKNYTYSYGEVSGLQINTVTITFDVVATYPIGNP